MAAALLVFCIYSCKGSLNKTECEINREDKTGAIEVKTSISVLQENGMDYGDGLDLIFSNGYSVESVPLLDGGYVNPGNYVLDTSLKNDSLVFYFKGDNNAWDKANLEYSDTVGVALKEKAKYKDLYNLHCKYMNNVDPATIQNKAEFQNIKGGNLRKDFYYSGLSLYNNNSLNSKIYEQLLQNNVTKCINLGPDRFPNGHVNNVITIEDYQMQGINVKNDDCDNKIIKALLSLVRTHDKTYICSSNNDNAYEYFSTIMLMLAGANYDEIIEDYMSSFRRNYGITASSDEESYYAIKENYLDPFLHKITKTSWNYDLKYCDFTYHAEMYLRTCGVHDVQIKEIINGLTKQD